MVGGLEVAFLSGSRGKNQEGQACTLCCLSKTKETEEEEEAWTDVEQSNETIRTTDTLIVREKEMTADKVINEEDLNN